MKNITNLQLAEQPLAHQIICTIKGFTVEVCRDRKSLNTAFRLRYRAYLGVDAIPENEEELLYDDFDFMPNAFVHLVWYQGKAVATVRGCIFSDYYGWTPTEGVNYFPKDTQEKLGSQTRLLESNRYAVDPEFQGRQSLFAQLLMFRAHALNSLAHGCSHIITAVRSRHIPFYQRFLGMEQLSSNKKYIPWADAEVALLSTRVNQCLEAALRRGMPDFAPEEVDHYAECAGITTFNSVSCIAA